MGYYTRHKLEIVEGNDYVTDYEKEISELADYGNCFEDEIKWYDHQKNMVEYSKRHPKVVFKLSGEGEESGDIWTEYYQDGKMQREKAEIKVAGFDKSKLT